MTDYLSDVFRLNVIAALRWRGWSRSDLAARLGTSTDMVSKTLNNPRNIGVTMATLGRYSDALGIDPSVMVTPGGVQQQASVRLERAS